MSELSTFLLPIISIGGAFIAGWFVATDKNRNELFKQKLESYKRLSSQICKIYTIGIGNKYYELPKGEDIHGKECAALLSMLFTESIFLEEKSSLRIFEFIKMKPEEYEENKGMIDEIIQALRHDLRINRLNFINQLSSLKR